MKNLNIKVAVIALGLFLGVSSSAKAQESEADKAAREFGVPTGSQVAEQAMAKALAEKAANDAIVQQQRNAEALKRNQTQTPSPSPSPSSKATQQ